MPFTTSGQGALFLQPRSPHGAGEEEDRKNGGEAMERTGTFSVTSVGSDVLTNNCKVVYLMLVKYTL